VLRLAKKAKDDQGKDLDAVQAALALLRQLKRALNTSLVVKVSEPEQDEDEIHEASSSSGRQHNRLNGKVPATAA
jgi:hypothetical protein